MGAAVPRLLKPSRSKPRRKPREGNVCPWARGTLLRQSPGQGTRFYCPTGLPGFVGTLFLFFLLPVFAGVFARQPIPDGSAKRISGPVTPIFTALTTRDGLSNDTVHAVVQDKAGFLWIGTEDGLNRYDGYAFKVFSHDPADPGSLADDFIWCALVDRSGSLWVGTGEGGLARYDRVRERFEHFRHDPADPASLSDDDVRCIYEDRSGALWVGTYQGGLNVILPGSRAFTRFRNVPKDPRSLSSNAVLSVVEDRDGALWVGTQNGLNRLDRSTGRFERVLNDPSNPASLGGNDVLVLSESADGRIWAGTNGGLSVFNPAEGVFRTYRSDASDAGSLSNNRILSILSLHNGDLWVGTLSGLNRLQAGTGRFERFVTDPRVPGTLNKDMGMSLFEDRSGNLWVGTNAGGLNKYSPLRQRFPLFRRNPSVPGSLSHDTIRSFAMGRDGTLWVGTLEGYLNRYDPVTRGFVAIRVPGRENEPDSVATVSAIREDRQGVLWLGTWGYGLKHYDLRTGKFREYRHNPTDPTSLSSDLVQFVFEDSRGILWIGTQDGLNRYDRARDAFTVIRSDPADPRSLSQNSLQSQAVCEGPDGSLWFGTWHGLNRYDPRSGRFERFLHQPGRPDSLSDNQIVSLCMDRSNTLWIGTYGGGLNRMSTPGVFRRYTQKQGLPNNVIYAILEDGRGRLWMSTNQGLSRFDPGQGVFRNYDVDDGLQGNQFFWGAAFRSTSGELFFGGTNGFNAFFPDDIADSLFVPPVVLTGFYKFNQPFPLEAPLEELREVELPWRDNMISFEFAALDFTAPGKNRYRYMLVGFDRDWIHTPAGRRVANYTNLAPGRYVLQVRGSNGDGVWNEAGPNVVVVVTPPFWRTRWAYAAYVILAGIVLLGAFRFYNRRHRREMERRQRELDEQIRMNERLTKADRLKNDFVSNVSHELKTPLTSIMGFAALMKKKLSEIVINEAVEEPKRRKAAGQLAENVDIILDEGSRMQALIQDLLDLDELESGSVTWRNDAVDMCALLRDVLDGFRPRAALRGIEVVDRVPGELPPVRGDRDRLAQVVSKLLDNALKFSPDGGRITATAETLRASADPRVADGKQNLLFAFSNAGEAISPEDQEKIFEKFGQSGDTLTAKPRGAGLGLPIARIIITRHGGRIWYQGAPDGSSVFCFTLPAAFAGNS